MDEDQKNQDKNKEKEDRILWEYAIQDVTPLHDAPEIKTQRIPSTSNHSERAIQKTIQKSNTAHNITNQKQESETDRRTAQKLKRGRIAIESRLDLHGLSKSQAYTALKYFIHDAYAQNLKCVLVITGKGAPRHGNMSLSDQTKGVLKTNVPQWLQETEFRPYVLKCEWAKPKDGGDGALYVLLRRKR